MNYTPYQPYRPPPQRGRMTSRHKTVAAVVFSVLALLTVLLAVAWLLGVPASAAPAHRRQGPAVVQLHCSAFRDSAIRKDVVVLCHGRSGRLRIEVLGCGVYTGWPMRVNCREVVSRVRGRR